MKIDPGKKPSWPYAHSKLLMAWGLAVWMMSVKRAAAAVLTAVEGVCSNLTKDHRALLMFCALASGSTASSCLSSASRNE